MNKRLIFLSSCFILIPVISKARSVRTKRDNPNPITAIQIKTTKEDTTKLIENQSPEELLYTRESENLKAKIETSMSILEKGTYTKVKAAVDHITQLIELRKKLSLSFLSKEQTALPGEYKKFFSRCKNIVAQAIDALEDAIPALDATLTEEYLKKSQESQPPELTHEIANLSIDLALFFQTELSRLITIITPLCQKLQKVGEEQLLKAGLLPNIQLVCVDASEPKAQEAQ